MDLIKVFLLSIVVFISGMAQGVVAGELASSSLLMEKLKRDGVHNVIVTVKPSLFYATRLSDTKLTDNVRKNIVSLLQDKALRGLNSANYSNLQRFAFTPQFALTVDEKGLQALQANEELEIQENKINVLSLRESVPRIFPNHSSSSYNGNNEWTVAVLDSGVDKNHPFLWVDNQQKVVSEACYSGGFDNPAVSSLCPGGVRASTAVNSGLPCTGIEGCEHGTHVAGIAAGNNPDFTGVAGKANVIAIQIASRISGYENCIYSDTCLGIFDSDIISGLERVYALRNTYKIASVNMSLGGSSYSGYCDSQPHKTIIDLLRGANIATVVASGNDGSTSYINSPACISSAIAVGSTLDTADSRSYFSNNSSALDLYAPGSNIVSSIPGGGYEEWSGTSMAAPHVTGAWAVLRQAAPSASVDQIESVLKSFGPVISVSGVDRRRVDLEASLQQLASKPVVAPTNYLLLR